ncbi:hypothetical protein [Elioraea tepidiphila]|uniref:hypothetical protein n=1 Tax=Elioraea tepidiphila TaxID=457934 RepID=UPI00037E44C7|nr:hypothetical protein [Elioraea tepidiphila]
MRNRRLVYVFAPLEEQDRRAGKVVIGVVFGWRAEGGPARGSAIVSGGLVPRGAFEQPSEYRPISPPDWGR